MDAIENQKKSPAAGNGGDQNSLTNLTKPHSFPQYIIAERAHFECVKRNDENPTPVNTYIAKIMGQALGRAYKVEVFNHG